MPKKIVVLYHKDCPDGFGAAWVAWKKFGSRAKYVGIHNGEAPPSGLKGKAVYLLDIGYDGETMRRLRKIVSKLTMLDHHVTRKDSIKLAHEYVFDLERSGAIISWNYFHPTKPAPYFLKVIQDYDLWQFKMPHTRELGAYISTKKYDFVLWNTFATQFEKTKMRAKYIEIGAAIRGYEQKVIERVVAAAQPARFAGHTILVANSFTLTSEIGNALAKKRPPFSVVWSLRNESVIVSLRSIKGFDVSRTALKFGGGGHKQAAGFRFPVGKPFPWTWVRK